MKILIFGDIFGRTGRQAFAKELPRLKELHMPDFVVVNIENCTSGRGPIEKHILELNECGIDVMTGGDHIFDHTNHVYDYLEKENSNLIRPANFYESESYKIPGKGYKVVEKNGKKLLVIHLLGNVFMGSATTYNPFLKVDEILSELGMLKKDFDGIIVDFHKETTAEGYGMAHFLDSRVSFVFGTHTHIQTNDELILPGGTGIISDVGMSGPLYSVIGADFDSVKKRFITGINKGKIEQCLDENYVVNGVCVELGDNGTCQHIEKIRLRGEL